MKSIFFILSIFCSLLASCQSQVYKSSFTENKQIVYSTPDCAIELVDNGNAYTLHLKRNVINDDAKKMEAIDGVESAMSLSPTRKYQILFNIGVLWEKERNDVFDKICEALTK